MRGARTVFPLASFVLLLAATPLVAATPCSDEPGFAPLACRVVATAEDPGALGPQLATIAAAVDRAAAVCVAGKTRRARARLAALGRRLQPIIENAPDDIVGDLRLIDALRRATLSRLEQHPCPELVEVLAPVAGEDVSGDVYVLVRLADAADPATLTGDLDGPGDPVPLSFAPTHVSATQAWTRVACNGAGRRTLRVRVAARTGTTHDEDKVPIECGPTAFGLGTEIETLVLQDHVPEAIRLEPVRPLRSGATYAVVATRRMRASRHGRFAASADFRAAIGLRPTKRAVPAAAHWSATADDPENPFPSDRLVQGDGTIRIPDGFTARFLPAEPRLDGVRAFLRGLDALSAEHRGFSPSTPLVLQFDVPVDLERTAPSQLFVVELRNPGPSGTNLRPLLDALHRERRIAPDAVAVATVFTVEDHVGTMTRIRSQLVERAATTPPVVDFTDPDPMDTRRFGVYRPGDPGFTDFFTNAAPATVGAVARGRFLSPDYREAGRFPDRFLDGTDAPPLVAVEFLLVVPTGTAPFPTVILQHGFCGDHRIVTQYAGNFTAAGLATIGIPAPEHGPRGNCFDFFVFDDFNAFGNNFRQSSVDLLQLVRLIATGIDLDGDTVSDLRGTDLGFLGISLGGVIGGAFTPIEPLVTTAVLNVPGGKLSQLAGASSPLAEPFLSSFADAAGISTRSCGGDPTAAACTSDATCGGATCLRNPDFTQLIEAGALDWQMQLDPGDGANYARGLRLAPEGAPRTVLVQEGIGDQIVANPLTEALARAIGLDANRPDASTGGVAGLWRFPPPEGHAIFGLAAVRQQAIGFLAGDGGSIVAP